MRPSFWQRLDSFARHLTPVALTFVLVILNVVPTHLPGAARVLPVLPLIAVFHWSIHRPSLMPASAVFLIGLFQDGLSGAPLGLHALIFLAVHGIVLFQHRFFMNKSFFVHWLGFALVAAGAAVLAWCLLSAFHMTLFEVEAIAFQYATTLALFPLFALVFARWQQAFLKAD